MVINLICKIQKKKGEKNKFTGKAITWITTVEEVLTEDEDEQLLH